MEGSVRKEMRLHTVPQAQGSGRVSGLWCLGSSNLNRFVVYVDRGEVLAFAARLDDIGSDDAVLRRVATAVDRAYWAGTDKTQADVVGRFLALDEHERVAAALKAQGFYADRGLGTFSLEDARRAATAI